MVECDDGTLYTGVTNDLDRRIYEHNNTKAGARYTRARRPVELVWSEEADDQGQAQSREHDIKSMSRRQKLELVGEGRDDERETDTD